MLEAIKEMKDWRLGQHRHEGQDNDSDIQWKHYNK